MGTRRVFLHKIETLYLGKQETGVLPASLIYRKFLGWVIGRHWHYWEQTCQVFESDPTLWFILRSDKSFTFYWKWPLLESHPFIVALLGSEGVQSQLPMSLAPAPAVWDFKLNGAPMDWKQVKFLICTHVQIRAAPQCGGHGILQLTSF